MEPWTMVWLIVVGAVGAAAAANPKWLWWKLSAWRFKNPEANEPSDTLYGLWRSFGFLALLVVVLVGLVKANAYLDRRHQEHEYALDREWREKHREPENRGAVPLTGYTPQHPTQLNGEYPGSAWTTVDTDSREVGFWCDIKWDIKARDDGTLVVNAHLEWAPKYRDSSDAEHDAKCHVERLTQDSPHAVILTISKGAPVVTDGPIQSCKNSQIKIDCARATPSPARPDQPLPVLNESGLPAQGS